jgi:2-polyprenyl-6-methoxyphenol hydroxylase-like FAD-dependent oxidoreductase
MKQMTDSTTDVLIVGAGPTGLMMACQFAIHQISFRIIDKNDSPSKNSGALIVQARSLEIFEQMGIACKALEQGIVADKLNILYNGRRITGGYIKDIGGNLSRFPFLLMLEQSKTEKLLLKFISDKGYSVERGVRFKSLVQDVEGVTSQLILPDATEQFIKTKYIIAADGASSTIRELLNIPFNGTTYPKPIFIMDCKAKTDMLPGEISFVFSDSNIAGFFPLQSSGWRIDSTFPKEMEKMEKITFDNVENDFHLWTKMNVKFQGYEWFSVSHSHQKYAGSIRVQNCFLAGDAAHINTPVGAQGMNTGLQDAFNLAWKLAFVIKHKAGPALLDTYSAERSAISRGFARYADTVFLIVTSSNIALRFFRLYVLKALWKFIFPVVEKQIIFRRRFFKSISQIGIHYRDSILSYATAGETFLHGAPRPGDRLPYVEFYYLGENTNNYKVLEAASFNLFVFARIVPDEIEIIAKEFNLTVMLITNLPETKIIYESMGIKNTGYYLIRPDIHIALRSSTLNAGYLRNYLQQFLMVKQ